MDPITKALEEVENQIPPQILRYAFIGQHNVYSRIIVNLSTVIREKIIAGRVLKDCSINGGVRDSVKISGLSFRSTDRGQRIYHIPKSLTQGRSLINPLSVGNTDFIRTVDDYTGAMSGSMVGLSQNILDTSSSIPYHTTDVRLVGENIILVEDVWDYIGNDIWLWGVFGNDEMMSDLNPRSWNVFEDLVVLATKAWIYNNCDIKIAEGVIEMGMEVGRFRDVVSEYSDANELYREAVKTRWAKVALLNDKGSRKRNTRAITPVYR